MKYILIPLIFFANYAFGQSFFERGYVVLKNQKDTITGQVDNLNWLHNPTKIRFKNTSGNEIIYQIESLNAFGFNKGEHYEIQKIDLDITPTETNNLLFTPNLLIKKDTILALKVLIKGDLSLFYFIDSNNKEHFFYSNFGQTTELINQFFYKVKEGENYLNNNKMYQGQLKNIFSNCKKNILTDKITFFSVQLVKKVIEYNECVGCKSTCYFKGPIDKAKIMYGLILGVSSYDFTITKSSVFGNTKIEDYLKNKTQYLGGSMSFLSKRNHGNNSFNIEMLYNKNKMFLEKTKTDYLTLNYLNFNLIYRKAANFKANIKPFVGIGLINRIIVSNSNSENLSDKSYKLQPISSYLTLETGLGSRKLYGNLRFSFDLLRFPVIKYGIYTSINYGKVEPQLLLGFRF